MITVQLTPDQLANVQTAVEHFLEYLDDHGEKDYDANDLEDLIQSTVAAELQLYEAGRAFFSR